MLLHRLKVSTAVGVWPVHELTQRGAVLTLIIGDPHRAGPRLVAIMEHSTYPNQVLDAFDATTFNMDFTFEPGSKPGAAYNRLEGNCALTLARSPVARGQMVGNARQLGANGSIFGEASGAGALGLQHRTLTRAADGHELLFIVNSQSVQSARYKLFSKTLLKLSDKASLALLPGMLDIELYTSPIADNGAFGQSIIVNKIWDLGDASAFHQAQDLLATPDEFFFGHEEDLDSEASE
ncbi:hypothetical protein T492DRAFT_1018654 [Pavlovales sp. CCMP2436]|nr:hypothetical protein T492DRAFT_1018654 [Pavlovales sp. CCMP2436]